MRALLVPRINLIESTRWTTIARKDALETFVNEVGEHALACKAAAAILVDS